MPVTFSNRPPEQHEAHCLPLRRAPAGNPIVGIVTSIDLTGTITHFAGGRTVPCTQPDCKHCTNGLPGRWHTYLAYLDARDRRHCLLEIPALATVDLAEWIDKRGTCRDCVIRVYRAGKKTNGRVFCNCSARTETDIVLPPPPNVHRILATIWHLPHTSIETSANRALDEQGQPGQQLIVPGIRVNAIDATEKMGHDHLK